MLATEIAQSPEIQITRLVVTSVSSAAQIRVILIDRVRDGLDTGISQCAKVLAGPDSFAATHLATGNIIKDVRFKSDIPTRSSGDGFRNVVVKLLTTRCYVSYLKRLAAADATLLATDLSSGTVTRECVRL